MVTRPRLWLKTTSEKGPHLSCVVFTGSGLAGTLPLQHVAANPSPLPKSMNAVVHLATKDAVDSP